MEKDNKETLGSLRVEKKVFEQFVRIREERSYRNSGLMEDMIEVWTTLNNSKKPVVPAQKSKKLKGQVQSVIRVNPDSVKWVKEERKRYDKTRVTEMVQALIDCWNIHM